MSVSRNRMDVRAAHLERPCASSLWARGRLPRATRCSSCAPAPRRSSGPSAPRAVLNLRHERLRTARVSAVRYSIPTWRAERTSCSWRSLRDKPPNSMSRWSSTSVPSVATGLPEAGVGASGSGAQESSGNPPNESPVESQTLIAPRASPGAGASPSSIRLSIPPSPYLTPGGAPLSHSQRSSSNAATGESLHVHPVLEDFESHTDSLPISTSEIRSSKPFDSFRFVRQRGADGAAPCRGRMACGGICAPYGGPRAWGIDELMFDDSEGSAALRVLKLLREDGSCSTWCSIGLGWGEAVRCGRAAAARA